MTRIGEGRFWDGAVGAAGPWRCPPELIGAVVCGGVFFEFVPEFNGMSTGGHVDRSGAVAAGSIVIGVSAIMPCFFSIDPIDKDLHSITAGYSEAIVARFS